MQAVLKRYFATYYQQTDEQEEEEEEMEEKPEKTGPDFKEIRELVDTV